MNLREALLTSLIAFLCAFAVSAIVSFAWNGIVHTTFATDWETSTRLAIIFGLIIPMLQAWERKRREKHT